MRQLLGTLMLAGWILAPVPTALADERADWGVALSAAGIGESTLLLVNDKGFQLVVVDQTAELQGAGGGGMTLTDVQPGDRLDYAVSTWAGMDIVHTLHVTSRRQAKASL